MNETPFKFTSEEKEQTLQILERLRTAVGDTFKPGDEQHLREDIQHAFINHQIKRNVFGMNPILAANRRNRSKRDRSETRWHHRHSDADQRYRWLSDHRRDTEEIRR